MTKTKSTKRALVMSLFALIMCISMLVGSTYAWFTDSVTSANNKIVAGKLDIQLLMDGNLDGIYEDISESNDPIFGSETSLIAQNNNADTLWEPGKTQVAYLAIKNNGNLALKYKVALDVTNVAKDLYKVMEYAIVPNADKDNKVADWTTGNSVVPGVQTVSDEVSLPVGTTHYFALAIHMNEDADNEYMSGQVNFDMTVLATQDTVEADSFNNQYDKNAGYNQGKTNVGPYKLDVLSGGNAVYDEATNTYNVAVATVAQGGYNATQGGKYYAGYTVNVEGYGEGATVSFDKNGSEVVWKLADEERDGFINNGIHQQWTSVGIARAYRYDIDGDGVTDFTVYNDASEAKVEVANAEELKKAIINGVDAVFVNDITVDQWVMYSETKTIGNGQIITVEMNGLTIDGNGHTLTVNSIESATNGDLLFDDASNLNISNLTIKYADGLAGGINLESGVISNVTFIGGGNMIYPGTGEITVENCTFIKNGAAFYNEHETDKLTVTGCTFNLSDDCNVILIRGDVKFTNNTINSGRTVNIVSGSPVVTGNDFNDVRLKVYSAATATISGNTINNLEFQTTNYSSTFADNTLSTEAQAALAAVTKN